MERHHATLIEKSNTLYDELLEHQIIPQIKRENDEQLSIKALSEVAHHLEEETAVIYRQHKIDVQPVFGFLKAVLGFTRFSVRGKPKVENEIGLALMATNLRKYAVRG